MLGLDYRESLTGISPILNSLVVNHNAQIGGALNVTGVISAVGGMSIMDGTDIDLGQVNGTRIGTLTAEKLAFYGSNPVAQQANSVDLGTVLSTLGLRALGGNPPLNLGTGAVTCGIITASGSIAANNGITLPQTKQIQMSFTSGNVGLLSASGTTLVMRGGTSGFGLVNNANTITIIGITDTGLWTFADGSNFAFGSTTGQKIGTATTQKFAFWNAPPIVQPTRAGQLADNSGGASGGNTIAAIVGAVDPTAATVTSTANAIATLAARLNSIEAKLSAAGGGVGLTA